MGKRVLWGFLLLALCHFALPARGENRIRALGCDHFLSQQDTAPASAQNTEAVLAALCGGEMHPAVALRCQDEVSSAADVALWLEQAFGEAESGDVSYLYLSSHGLWNPGQSASDMALLLSDGTQEGRITAGELHTLLSRYPGTKVLLVDACHAGAMIGKGVRETCTICSPGRITR